MKNILEFIRADEDRINVIADEISNMSQESKKGRNNIVKLKKEMDSLKQDNIKLEKMGRNMTVIRYMMTLDAKWIKILLSKYGFEKMQNHNGANSSEDIMFGFKTTCIEDKFKKTNRVKYKACLYWLFKSFNIELYSEFSEHRFFMIIDKLDILSEELLDIQYEILKKTLNNYNKTVDCCIKNDDINIDYDRILFEELFSNLQERGLISKRAIHKMIEDIKENEIENKCEVENTMQIYEYKPYSEFVGISNELIGQRCIDIMLNLLLSLDSKWLYFLLKSKSWLDIFEDEIKNPYMIIFKSYELYWNVSNNAENDYRLRKEACLYTIYEFLFPFDGNYLVGMRYDGKKAGKRIYNTINYEDDIMTIFNILNDVTEHYVECIDKLLINSSIDNIETDKILFEEIFGMLQAKSYVNKEIVERNCISLIRKYYH